MIRENSRDSEPKRKLPWLKATLTAQPSVSGRPRCWRLSSARHDCSNPIIRLTDAWPICFAHKNGSIVPLLFFNGAENTFRLRPASVACSPWAGVTPLSPRRTATHPRTKPCTIKSRSGWKLFKNYNGNGNARTDDAHAECFCASKYSRVTLKTIGASNNKPTRFGTAIRPLRVSDTFQTKSTFTSAKPRTATTHNAR